MKIQVRNFIHRVKSNLLKLSIKAKFQTNRLQAVLADDTGASAIEIMGAAVFAIAMICLLMEAFTGLFSKTVLPGIQEKINSIFAMG